MTTTEPRPIDALPHWDLTPFFPSLDSREFLSLNEEVGAEVGHGQWVELRVFRVVGDQALVTHQSSNAEILDADRHALTKAIDSNSASTPIGLDTLNAAFKCDRVLALACEEQ